MFFVKKAVQHRLRGKKISTSRCRYYLNQAQDNINLDKISINLEKFLLGLQSGTIHSHSHLILDPGSASCDDLRGALRNDRKVQIQDPGSGGCGSGFYTKYKNFWTEVLIFDKI